jgi:lipopolysaccharide transport system ATP-binding protein
MSDTLIKVENVSKKFCRRLKRSLWYGMKDLGSELIGRSNSHKDLRTDEFWAVDDVSFELKRGECLGLIGPNGSGKSTLLKMPSVLIKLDKGKITMQGRVGDLFELRSGFKPVLTGRGKRIHKRFCSWLHRKENIKEIRNYARICLDRSVYCC